MVCTQYQDGLFPHLPGEPGRGGWNNQQHFEAMYPKEHLMGQIRDRLRALWWAVTDHFADLRRALADASTRTKVLLGGGATVLVAALVAGLVIGIGGGGQQPAPEPVRLAVATNNDLPANLWTGWTETELGSAPAAATEAPDTTATPEQCVPGGPLQRDVQLLGVDGSQWAGTKFVNVGLGAQATAMIAANDRDVVKAVDAWSAKCGQATVTTGTSKMEVAVKQLPVNASTYRLHAARVVAQTVTPVAAGAEPESSTLTAVGRSGRYVTYVTLMFPGPVTDDAIATLDTVWRAQAAKLVAYQQAGEL